MGGTGRPGRAHGAWAAVLKVPKGFPFGGFLHHLFKKIIIKHKKKKNHNSLRKKTRKNKW